MLQVPYFVKKIDIVFLELVGLDLGFGDLLARFPHGQVPLALVSRDVFVVLAEISYQLLLAVLFLLELGLGLKQYLPNQELAVAQLADSSPRFFSVAVETGLGVESRFAAALFTICVAAELAENCGLLC